VSLVVAAGPFTTKSELSFEPLEELLEAVAQQGAAPTALLLAGPFLDAAHPAVAAGQLEASLQHVYEQEVNPSPSFSRITRCTVWAPVHRPCTVPRVLPVMSSPYDCCP
jgi:DNA polymerase alpha/epsilon subunit B